MRVTAHALTVDRVVRPLWDSLVRPVTAGAVTGRERGVLTGSNQAGHRAGMGVMAGQTVSLRHRPVGNSGTTQALLVAALAKSTPLLREQVPLRAGMRVVTNRAPLY